MVSIDEVLAVARLARINIEDGKAPQVQAKFSSMLEHFRFLNEVDTTQVIPMFHATEKMELRSDDPEKALEVEELLQNAPESFDHCFKIPRVVGGAE